MSKLLGGAFLIIALAGCAGGGIEPGGKFPSATFEVGADYLAAYRRAAQYFRICYVEAPHRYGVSYVGRGGIDEKGTIGTLQLMLSDQPAAPLVMVTSSPAAVPGKSNVTVTVLGQGRWNQQELDAAKQSIQSATPACLPD
jgi:hypothetical protein